MLSIWTSRKFFSFSHNVFYPSRCCFQFLSHIYFVVCKCFQFGPVENVSPFPQCSFPMLFSVFESLFCCRLQMLSIWTSRKFFSFFHNVFNPSRCCFQFLSHIYFVVCKCFQFGPVENVSPFPQCSFPMLFSVFESLFFCRLQMLSIWTSRKCFSFLTMFLPNAIFSF